jgi:hypothetical protein
MGEWATIKQSQKNTGNTKKLDGKSRLSSINGQIKVTSKSF